MAGINSALPPPTVPMVDLRTGCVTPAWYRYLQTDHERVGGGVEDKVEVAAQSGEVAKAAADDAHSAADLANAAAGDASAAAAAASAGALSAINAADVAFATAALSAAYPSGLTLTGAADGTDAKIGVSDHAMIYSDKTVSVTGSSVTGLAYDTLYNIYYDDPGRVGGAVTFHAVTGYSAFPTAANPDRVFIGTAKTPPTSADPSITGNPRSPYGQNTSI